MSASADNPQARPDLGLTVRLTPGDREAAEAAVHDLQALGVGLVRIPVALATLGDGDRLAWYDWLLDRLAQDHDVLAVLALGPAALPTAAGGPGAGADAGPPPPRNGVLDAPGLLELMIRRWGPSLSHVELAWHPEDLSGAHWLRDPDGAAARDLLGRAAEAVRASGRGVVFGGALGRDPVWLRGALDAGVVRASDVVGLSLSPPPDAGAGVWDQVVARVRRLLGADGPGPDLWVTDTGWPGAVEDDLGRAERLLAAADAPVARVYWDGLRDARPGLAGADGRNGGLRRHDGRPRAAFRLWAAGGLDNLRNIAQFGRVKRAGPDATEDVGAAAETDVARPRRPGRRAAGRRPVLVTGGAGFVGTNLVHRLASDGRPVIVFDNLSRPGVERNLRWLVARHAGLLDVRLHDVRDAAALAAAAREAEAVFHLAAQVAVTTSLADPADDLAHNVGGTFHLLEALRGLVSPPPLLYTSTNKVYGDLADVRLVATRRRWQPADRALRTHGIPESRPLEFHSPYGCSKGAADQYVLDYARCYGLPAVVLRMSCIYGPHQMGTEDQGWVAHFVLRALEGGRLTIFGDGRQVRDVLFVTDLVDAFLRAEAHIEAVRGRAFNIGGGPANAISLLELVEWLAELPRPPRVTFAPWRTGDQRYYVSDPRAFAAETGWAPVVGAREGIERLQDWLLAQRPARRGAAATGGPRAARRA